MKAYIAISFSKRNSMDAIVRVIKETLLQSAIDSFVFADEYHFSPEEEKGMMQQAMQDIDSCDMLLAEVSEKAIGIGIEAGYAKAKGKPVIYLRQRDAEHSTTLSGISDFSIFYRDTTDLQAKLETVLKELIK